MRTSNNDIRRGNITQAKNKLAAAQTKDGKEYIIYYMFINRHIPGQKNTHLGKGKTKVTDVIEQVRRRKWTWAGHASRI